MSNVEILLSCDKLSDLIAEEQVGGWGEVRYAENVTLGADIASAQYSVALEFFLSVTFVLYFSDKHILGEMNARSRSSCSDFLWKRE